MGGRSVSLGSDLGVCGIGVEGSWDAESAWRNGVGGMVPGTFFLCERFPVLVRCCGAEPGAGRGVAGVMGVTGKGMGAEPAMARWAS